MPIQHVVAVAQGQNKNPDLPWELVNGRSAQLLIARHHRRRAEDLGVSVVEIDGSRSLDEIISLVDAQFAPMLSGEPRS